MSILSYWKSHPEFWISIENQTKADYEITQTFWKTDLFPSSCFISNVIYLDQFMRHFSRVSATDISEDDVIKARCQAYNIVLSNRDNLILLEEDELYFCLMACKHVFEYDFIFQTIHLWLKHNNHVLISLKILSKFYYDTYRKAYTIEKISENLFKYNDMIDYINDGNSIDDFERYNLEDIEEFTSICDYFPKEYIETDWLKKPIPELASKAVMQLSSISKIDCSENIVSLSGGVDSMLMCYLMVRSGIPVKAVHIIYGNRNVSFQEAHFIGDFCYRLNIPLYLYKIDWLKRGEVDREFYESMTRAIRFSVYKAVGGKVFLGHIQEDVVENIWTNFAHGTHLDNLAKMSEVGIEDEVIICRPWLTIKKSDIYELSSLLAIPYLKNTTPSWSNRGKFRTTFYSATHTQYGLGVDTKVIEVAKRLKEQSELVDRLLYLPIYDSWNVKDRTIDATRAIEASIDEEGWSKIFKHVCHMFLGISKPSIHACRNFAERCRLVKGMPKVIHLKKDLSIEVVTIDKKILLKFI